MDKSTALLAVKGAGNSATSRFSYRDWPSLIITVPDHSILIYKSEKHFLYLRANIVVVINSLFKNNLIFYKDL